MEPAGALPIDLSHGATEVTRVSCPDCTGVLAIQVERAKNHIRLICRVGHTYSVPDLLIAKEERLEEMLWATLHGLQEMAELLEDLRVYADRQRLSEIGEALQDRAQRTRANAAVMRRIIEQNRAVELTDEAAKIRGGPAS